MKSSVDYSTPILTDDVLKSMKPNTIASIEYGKVKKVEIYYNPFKRTDDALVFFDKGLFSSQATEYSISRDSAQTLVELLKKTPLAQMLKISV